MKKIIFSSLCMALAMGLNASAGGVLTLEDAVSSAFENNISLEIAQIELKQSLRNANTASSYIPDLSIDGSFTAAGSAIGSTGGLEAKGGIGISMSLGTDLITDASAKSIERTLANLAYAATADSLEESVTTSYWNLASGINQIEVARKSLESAESNYEDIAQAYESGLKSELDLANAELAVAEAEYSLKLLEDAYELSEDNFRILTGIETDPLVLSELPGTVYLDLPSAEELYDTYAGGTNTIRTYSAKVDQSETALKTTRLDAQLPSVTLSAGWEIGPSGTYAGSWDGRMEDDASVTVAFSIPISSYIPGSSGHNRVEDAKDAVAVARLNLKEAEDTLENDISTLLVEIDQNRENLDLAQKKLGLAERAYSLGREAYGSGLMTTSDFLDLEDSLFSARMTLSDARYAYFGSCNSLGFLLGLDYETLVDLYGGASET